MSDIKLFRFTGGSVSEITGASVAVERSLQNLIEANLETFLGVRFLASEYRTDREHGGRMDTLGIDENNCPVIIEYKKSSNQNIINQGLFYLDWLMSHKEAFQWLIMEKLGLDQETASKVEWSSPRLLLIAGGFTKYDEHAIKQINRNIELIRYRQFGDDLLLLELVNATVSEAAPSKSAGDLANNTASESQSRRTSAINKADEKLRDLHESIRSYLLALGDDVREKPLGAYTAFKRIKNFACLELRISRRHFLAYVKINPDSVTCEEGFTRDVRSIGHYGTGDLEIVISSMDDLERAKPLFEKSYENS